MRLRELGAYLILTSNMCMRSFNPCHLPPANNSESQVSFPEMEDLAKLEVDAHHKFYLSSGRRRARPAKTGNRACHVGSR